MTVLVALVALWVAFRLGSRHRHNSRTWSDYKLASTATKNLAKQRWTTLGAVFVAGILVALFISFVGAFGLHVFDTRNTSVTVVNTPSTPAGKRT
jgi:hypothetical protein